MSKCVGMEILDGHKLRVQVVRGLGEALMYAPAHVVFGKEPYLKHFIHVFKGFSAPIPCKLGFPESRFKMAEGLKKFMVT